MKLQGEAGTESWWCSGPSTDHHQDSVPSSPGTAPVERGRSGWQGGLIKYFYRYPKCRFKTVDLSKPLGDLIKKLQTTDHGLESF